ncbi:hypothetical protein [Oceaniglobus trochenteri]|uniref:hypothetical protein n=1 Tax=Oceaniglobus trochenteri TaxID=2763260 RepID=UPI001CFFB59C|nr:hypothetical protein [Oceaniglobus trochenteri]
MFLIRLSSLTALVSLSAGCEAPPAVAAFNGQTVTIQQMGYDFFSEEAQAEADRICAQDGKRAEAQSMTRAASGLAAPVINYLYLCVPKSGSPRGDVK